MLRLPTFQGLRERLRRPPHFFHLIHFDGPAGDLQPRIKAIWEEAGLGPFPEAEG